MAYGGLPLQQGLARGSMTTDARISAMMLRATDQAGVIRVRAGIFYSSVIAGCSCADDPAPVDENAEYREVELRIDKATGEAEVVLADD